MEWFDVWGLLQWAAVSSGGGKGESRWDVSWDPGGKRKVDKWSFIVLTLFCICLEAYIVKCKNRKSESSIGSAVPWVSQASLFCELVKSMLAGETKKRKEEGRGRRNVGLESAGRPGASLRAAPRPRLHGGHGEHERPSVHWRFRSGRAFC